MAEWECVIITGLATSSRSSTNPNILLQSTSHWTGAAAPESLPARPSTLHFYLAKLARVVLRRFIRPTSSALFKNLTTIHDFLPPSYHRDGAKTDEVSELGLAWIRGRLLLLLLLVWMTKFLSLPLWECECERRTRRWFRPAAAAKKAQHVV